MNKLICMCPWHSFNYFAMSKVKRNYPLKEEEIMQQKSNDQIDHIYLVIYVEIKVYSFK